jgi:putative ABC transport system substrate-binding protein
MTGFAARSGSLQPEIVVTGGTVSTVAAQRETRTIPIVFVNVAEPVASGIGCWHGVYVSS